MRNIPTVTKNILIINIFMLLFTLLREPFMYENFALFYPSSPYFHWWQPVTHMFMHGGVGHLFVNMFTLLMFGCTLERVWGGKKFLTFYFVTGLGAAALHLGVMYLQMQHNINLIAQGGEVARNAMMAINRLKMIPTVGASGAVYGILIGYAMLFPDSRLTLIFPPISLSAKWWVIIWAVVELLTGLASAGDGVAHFAHLGGMLFGFLLITYWKRKGTMYQHEGDY